MEPISLGSLALGKTGGEEPDDGEGGDAILDEAFADLAAAIKSGDSKAGVEALRALRDLDEG